MKYLCINRHRNKYPIRMMCSALKVSKSGYYAWKTRPESERVKSDRELTKVITDLHLINHAVYGAPKMHDELKAAGYHCGKNRVAKLMRQARLSGCPKRRYKITTKANPSHPVASNLLKQDFNSVAPNRKRVSDITYISTREG